MLRIGVVRSSGDSCLIRKGKIQFFLAKRKRNRRGVMNTKIGISFGLALLMAIAVFATMFALGMFSTSEARVSNDNPPSNDDSRIVRFIDSNSLTKILPVTKITDPPSLVTGLLSDTKRNNTTTFAEWMAQRTGATSRL